MFPPIFLVQKEKSESVVTVKDKQVRQLVFDKKNVATSGFKHQYTKKQIGR